MGLLDKVIQDGYQEPSGNMLQPGPNQLVKLNLTNSKKTVSSGKSTPQINAVYENSDGSITDFITISETTSFHWLQLLAAMMGRAPEDFTKEELVAMDKSFGNAHQEDRDLERLYNYFIATAKKFDRPFFIDVTSRKYQGKDQVQVSIFKETRIRAANDTEARMYQPASAKEAAGVSTSSVDDEPPLP